MLLTKFSHLNTSITPASKSRNGVLSAPTRSSALLSSPPFTHGYHYPDVQPPWFVLPAFIVYMTGICILVTDLFPSTSSLRDSFILFCSLISLILIDLRVPGCEYDTIYLLKHWWEIWVVSNFVLVGVKLLWIFQDISLDKYMYIFLLAWNWLVIAPTFLRFKSGQVFIVLKTVPNVRYSGVYW